jgi:hypothetical protein
MKYPANVLTLHVGAGQITVVRRVLEAGSGTLQW